MKETPQWVYLLLFILVIALFCAMGGDGSFEELRGIDPEHFYGFF